jgi:peptidoglycan/LPS O-acetylase OafA/YrhL
MNCDRQLPGLTVTDHSQGYAAERNEAIDGLRAVAVLSVLIFHFMAHVLPGGYIGVDVFFVISGYVVCRSVQKFEVGSFRQLLADFYSRRVLRIYPALILCLLTTVVVAKMFFPISFLSDRSNSTGQWAFWGLSNMELLNPMDSYFGVITDYNPYLHTWSLAVEEQFYIFFPIWFFIYRRARIGFKTPVRVLIEYSLIGMVVASIVYSAWCSYAKPNNAFYLITSRFWELGLGVLLGLFHSQSKLLPRVANQSLLLSVLGFLGIVGSMFFSVGLSHPVPGALLPVFGSMLLISGVASNSRQHWVGRFLSHPVCVYVGRASYSIYLWHWPIFVLIRWTCGIDSGVGFICALPLTLLVSLLSYHIIEMPFQFIGRYRGSVLLKTESKHGSRVSSWSFSWAYVVVFIGIVVIFTAHQGFRMVLRSSRFELTKTKSWYEIDLNEALDSKPWKGRSLYIVGDSHAFCYSTLAELLRRDMGVKVVVQPRKGGNFASLIHESTEFDEVFAESVLSEVRQSARPGDVVLLAALRVKRLCDQWQVYDLAQVVRERDSSESERERLIAVEQGVEIIQRMQSMGLNVVIAAPTPILAAPPFRISDWFNQMNPIGRFGTSIDKSFLDEHRAPAMRSIAEVVRRLPHVHVWDPFDVLCPDSKFHGFDGDRPLLSDGDHLTPYANQKVYPSFKSVLKRVWSY